MKAVLFAGTGNLIKKASAIFLFVVIIAGIYLLNLYIEIDYGFWGCMLPVLTSLFRKTSFNISAFEKTDKLCVHIVMLTVGLLILSFTCGFIQIYSLVAVLFLSLYSGKRGKIKMKYFFYIFYPVHLAALEIISML